jgi:hypothetical protein
VGIILTWRVIAIFRVTGRPDSAVNGSDCEDSTEFGGISGDDKIDVPKHAGAQF